MKYRFPIKVSAYIEMDAEATVVNAGVIHRSRIVVDELDWEFGPWPRVSPYGEDDLVVQIDDGVTKRIEADADVVVPLRQMVEASVYDHGRWELSRTVEKDIVDGTE